MGELFLAETNSEAYPGEERPSDMYVDFARSVETQHRVRRSNLDKPVFGYLSGEGVEYEKKVKCNELDCPVNTKCYEMYPAQCRADPGFIQLSSGVTLPFDGERMFRLDGLRFDMQWRESLSDFDSFDFQSLASRTEDILFQMITDLGITDVLHMKIVEAREGSIVVSVICFRIP